jgi:hypothetical protein
VLPEADNGRYRLNGVATDLATFTDLTSQAAPATQPAAAAGLLRDAMSLIRGRPFQGSDYRWTHLAIANLETQIADAANQLAELSMRYGDPATATWAARQGLTAPSNPTNASSATSCVPPPPKGQRRGARRGGKS